MSSYNRVILVGNLTRDPEVKQLASGTTVADIGLAVNNRVKKGEQWVDETCFVDVSFFGRTAEVIGEYLTKGSKMLVEGKLKMESWEKDGQKRSKLKVVGDIMQMLDSKSAAPAEPNPFRQQQESGGDDPFTDNPPF